MAIKLVSKGYLEFKVDENNRQSQTIELENESYQEFQIKVKTTNPQVYTADQTTYSVKSREKRILIQILAIDPDKNKKDQIMLEIFEIKSQESSMQNAEKQYENQKIYFDIVFKESSQSIIKPTLVRNGASEIQKSQFLSQYQKVSQLDQTYHTVDQNESQKQSYEELLIKTDEQEKELFQLSELKNRLQRQLNKQKFNVESHKNKEFHNIHIGYAIIIVILSFVVGLFIKD